MSTSFLTAAERDRWQRFPKTIPQDDLAEYFLLSDADQREVNRQREPCNRLGYALQLCALRYLGFVPTDFTATPEVAVTFVAEQLRLASRVLALYTNRRTQSEQRRLVRAYVGFRPATPMDVYALQTWLVARALEHEKPTLLLQLACEKLHRERIVRPGITRLERFVATAREKAHEETFRQLLPLLTDERKTFLDGLLQLDATTGRTPLHWLRQEAVSHAASHIIATLTKIAFLQDAGVAQWELASLNPNRAKWLAQIGWKSTNQYLQRMAPARRYPVLIAFLQQALLHHTDVVIELFDQCLWGCHSEAKHELEEFRKTMARSTNDKLQLFRELGHILLDDDIADPDVRAVSFERVPKPVLQEAIEETQGLIRPRPDDAIDFFAKRYSYLRQFVPLWLQTLTLHAQGPDDTVLRAVEVIRALDRAPTRRPVPTDAPMALVTDAWRPYIREPDGEISRRYYELCTLWHLRSALRSGRVWVEHSQRYADPDTYLIPPAEWSSRRLEVIRQTGTPGEGLQRLVERETELAACMAQVEKLLARKDSHVRVEDDKLILTPLEADKRPASAEALEDLITARLPLVELSELLIEVDAWTHFSDHFVHAAGAEMLRPPLRPHLYASILAHACNFGLEQMAQSTDVSYRQLAWCTTWYMREETLEAAFTNLVNYHHKLPLSQAWGSGILSSSDGQRLPVSGKNRHARAFPPTLGYGQGLTFYSWTSDQLSQYGSKPVIITARDATYVLDAILGNETELAIVEHTTDTAGATEIIFALFDLLGLRFTPRLRDIGSRRLYRSGGIDLHHYPRLQPHIQGRINRQRVLDWWDDMLRAAGSMKLGHVTASLLVQKMQAYPQQNALAQALQEYGRLIRTLHVLRWYANNEDRRRVMRQLNKGEALHDLRAYLMIANKGQLRRKRGDELVNQASCLNLVTNAVIVWNTVYMAAAVAQLKREGYPVTESDLAHIWPTRYEHINVYGRYHFNIEEAQRREGLRPLRPSAGNMP
ncbi:MAG: Tn3 family transposase [Acidobacteria bacterium]|nr:Tn3 family transposase [Acidobacteriota bacterium]MBV9484016.1 Tn3 family transposase [Acidobacteriota bacterium]